MLGLNLETFNHGAKPYLGVVLTNTWSKTSVYHKLEFRRNFSILGASFLGNRMRERTVPSNLGSSIILENGECIYPGWMLMSRVFEEMKKALGNSPQSHCVFACHLSV